MSIKKAIFWAGFWLVMALIFNGFIYFTMGSQKALEFLGGYIIEQSLSVDNLFLFLVIFSSFGIPTHYQRRVLNYGIGGAIILRLIFIVLGVAIVNTFSWILYVFGIILIFSGIKIFAKNEEAQDFKNSRIIKLFNKIIPVSEHLDGQKFFTRRNGILFATPLLAILVVVEITDIIFAIDSIPAIFAITLDPVIVYSSNIFAIMGLRNLYFLLEKLNNAFAYVKYGVGLILMFVGVKLAVLFFHIHINIIVSLLTIAAILAGSILASFIVKKKQEQSI